MGLLSETLLGVFGGPGHRLLLLAGLIVAVFLSWRAWRQTDSTSARYTWHGAFVLTAALCVWLVFEALARVANLPPQLWISPFDRALATAILLILGWTLIPATSGGRRWRPVLIAVAAVAIVAYSGWAPTWASEFSAQAGLDLGCTQIPPIPLCAEGEPGDPGVDPATCQVYTQVVAYMSTTDPVGPVEDFFLAADDFTPLDGGTITEI